MQDSITVVGTVASTPERRRTATGVAVAHFRLASTRRRRDQGTGEWRDDGTNWYSVSAYRTLAEHALASIEKGHRVIVTGSFRLREWEAGEKRGKEAEIDADALGHDLLWGTTTYVRERAGTAAVPTTTPPSDDEVGWAPAPGDGPRAADWGAPDPALAAGEAAPPLEYADATPF